MHCHLFYHELEYNCSQQMLQTLYCYLTFPDRSLKMIQIVIVQACDVKFDASSLPPHHHSIGRAPPRSER